jgi:ankyrin repeat protein
MVSAAHPILQMRWDPVSSLTRLPHSLPRRCCCEDSLSRELIKRLTAYPALRVHLDKLQPKVFALSSDADATPIEVNASELDVAADIERINKSKFTSKGDHPVVVGLYTKYVHNTVGALEKTLGSLQLESTEGAQVALPPMPADTGFASMRAWHLDCLRAQHAYIPDALSGQQLSTLTECVPIGVEGHDANGKPLAVRDARSLCAWLHDLRANAHTCALLTAGPAAGKTWLMSQLIMHALGQVDRLAEDDGREPLVPVLVRAEQLQKRLAEQGAAFDAANDWVDADLKLTCAPPHYAMLRTAMHERRVLLLLDGLDEAGAQRARIEKHVAEVLAPKGFVILCTSRPAGLDEAGFAGFHRLTLAPLSDEQQEAFLATRLGDKRASALKSYLCDKVPLDAGGEAGTKRRVTANPLMLSMVCSIAQLRVGIDMPTTTAELYEVAAGAMLKRSGAPVSDDARVLLQATFFEAHADEQRIITEAHLAAATARIGMRIGMAAAQRAADELRALVARDGLPLVRLLEAEPLQMQAFHLSFQEYFAMLAIGKGGVPLPSFVWGVWWTNAVLMGVQAGGAAFGDAFVKAAQLPATKAAAVPAKEAWRLRVLATLVHKGLPAAWLPTALEAAKGVAREAAREAAKLAAADALVVGKRVLALDKKWQPAVVERVEGDTVDVKIQGWEKKKGLPRTKALVVASNGVGALLRLAAGAGDAALVEALLDAGVNPLVADERANTPLHRAAAGGHVAICCALLAKGADKDENNTQFQSAAKAAATAKQHAVVRLFVPTLSDKEFTDEACTRTERLRAAATGDVATLARTQDAGRITALMVASRRKHLAAVVKLLESSNASTLNAQSAEGCTALYLAAEEGAEPIVQRLLTRGADAALAASDGGTPLMRASSFGHELCLRVLLEAKADQNKVTTDGMTALMFAALNGHELVIRELVRHASLDLADKDGTTALMYATRNGHVGATQALLDAGADPNCMRVSGFTALMFAAKNGYKRTLVALLQGERPVEVDMQTLESKKDKARAGTSALMLAAQNGHASCVRELLYRKARVELADKDGTCALMYASRNGHVEAVKALLAVKETGVDQAKPTGMTSLMFAAKNGYLAVVSELLKHGANVNLVNHNTQHTALIEACENGHVSVAASLLRAGAQESVGGDLGDAARATLAMARNGHQGSSMDIGRI